MKSNQTLALLTLLLFTFFNYNSVAQDNEPPTLINPIEDKIIKEDQHFNFNLKLNEVFSDESPLTFSVDLGNADWLANVGDSVLVGFPLEEHVGEFMIVVTAIDATGNISSTSFSITVTSEDDKPIVLKNLPGQLQRPGFGEIKISYKDLFYDEEDESLSYDVRSSYPAVVTASIAGDSILIREKGSGPAEIILTAIDSHGNETTLKMFIRVYEDAEILNMTTANTGSNGLSNSYVTCVRNDNSGNIWATSRTEINKYNDGKWEQFTFDDILGDFFEIWDDRQGNTYFISNNEFLQYDGKTFTHSYAGHTFIPDLIRHSWVSNDSVLYLAGENSNNTENFTIIKSTESGWETLFHSEGNDIEVSHEIRHICTDATGDLWMITQQGLEKLQNGVRVLISNDYDLSNYVWDMTSDIFGNIWFNNSSEVFKYIPEKNALQKFGNISSMSLYADDIGNIWVGGNGGEITKIKNDKVTRHLLKAPVSTELNSLFGNTIKHIAKTSDGRYWFSTGDGLFIAENYSLKDESTIVQHTFDGLPSNVILSIIRDDEGMYWVNTDSGVSTYNGINWEYKGAKYIVFSIDKEGRRLCKSHNDESIIIIDKNNKQTEYAYPMPEYGIFDMVFDNQNNIWIAGARGISMFDGINWTFYSTNDGLLDESVDLLFADSKGNIWFDYSDNVSGISEERTFAMFNGSSFIHHTITVNNHFVKRIEDIVEDKEGNIWLAGENIGIVKFDGKNLKYFGENEGLKDKYTRSLTTDYLGGIWITYFDFGTEGNGVSRFDGTKFDHFTTEDGLPTNKVKNIYVEHALTNQNKSGSANKNETTDLIWLGTGDKGTANFYVQTTTAVADRSLPEMKVIIFPNPTQGITNIIIDNQQRKYLDIEVLTMDGKSIYKNLVQDLTKKVQVNLTSFPPGTYYIQLKSDLDSVSKMIIKT